MVRVMLPAAEAVVSSVPGDWGVEAIAMALRMMPGRLVWQGAIVKWLRGDRDTFLVEAVVHMRDVLAEQARRKPAPPPRPYDGRNCQVLVRGTPPPLPVRPLKGWTNEQLEAQRLDILAFLAAADPKRDVEAWIAANPRS